MKPERARQPKLSIACEHRRLLSRAGSDQFARIETVVPVPRRAAQTGGSDVVVVWITAPAAEAVILAQRLVEEGLAACVNRFPAVQSTYMWEGKVNTDEEALMMAKTTVAGKAHLLSHSILLSSGLSSGNLRNTF
eukprot:m.750656 g.750656  ORF g.750656 m.750656 type:complete len:135 (-) comp23162_c0_seq7:6-410(-)